MLREALLEIMFKYY